MNELVTGSNTIPAMSEESIAKVTALEAAALLMPQIQVETHHLLHAGVYSRTVFLHAGALIVGVMVKIPTTLTVCGDCTVFIGDSSIRVTGYNVFPAAANRKQAFVVHADTVLTMSFQTNAATVEDAEAEFTDELDKLVSRNVDGVNHVLITEA